MKNPYYRKGMYEGLCLTFTKAFNFTDKKDAIEIINKALKVDCIHGVNILLEKIVLLLEVTE